MNKADKLYSVPTTLTLITTHHFRTSRKKIHCSSLVFVMLVVLCGRAWYVLLIKNLLTETNSVLCRLSTANGSQLSLCEQWIYKTYCFPPDLSVISVRMQKFLGDNIDWRGAAPCPASYAYVS